MNDFVDAWGDPDPEPNAPDDEGYEDGDWGLCNRCQKKLKKYEDIRGLCGNCCADLMHEAEQASRDDDREDGEE